MGLLDPKQLELYQYLYDLQGYLVIKDVLSKTEVERLNSLIDIHAPVVPEDWEQQMKNHKAGVYNIYRFGMAGGSYASSPGFLDWGQPFIDLVDHPLVMEIMRLQLGDCFRLDRIFGMRMRKGMPNGRLHSDYGASEPFTKAEPGKYYPQPNHQALHGFGVAVFNLTDSGPDTGGLRLIPSSHNSHFKLPDEIRNEEIENIAICPDAPAGSLVLFSEATTHGTAFWKADHERRSLLYKYCASQLSWSRTRVTAPDQTDLTHKQSLLLQEPAGAHWFFPSLFEEDEAELAAD